MSSTPSIVTDNEFVTQAPIIEAVGLSKVYQVGKQMISPVSDITFQIGYGDFVVIFGPSGSGKSTLLNILMGVEPPDIGQVLLKGESLYDFSEEERTTIRLKRFGLVPQDQFWMDNLDVAHNVSLPLLLQGKPMSEALHVGINRIEQVGLSGKQKQRAHELSSGQQQRAQIARALVNDPWIVFADEPTAHLDSKSIAEVIDLLRGANQQGLTIVMVTHDLQFLKYAKKWFFVRDGRLYDIKDQKNPFHDLQDAMNYIESQGNDAKEEKSAK
jgi:putative ABC transport system ATP-binding protein